MSPIELSQESYRHVTGHALEVFPDECCGLVVRQQGRQSVVHASNLQNDWHATAPEGFRRTAREAFVMGPEIIPALLGHDRGELVIEAFYHSHPQRGAYFSAEDRKHAEPWMRDPAYRNIAHIVISVRDSRVEDLVAFRWCSKHLDFTETSIAVL